MCILKIFPDGTREVKTKRFNPTIPISPEATEVHGIDDLTVSCEPPFSSYAKSLFELLEGCDLGGFNLIRFDLPLLVEEFARCGISFPEEGTKFNDPMSIYHKKEKRDLTAAYKFYCDKDLEGAHGAEADILATHEIFEAQLDRYDDLGENVAQIEAFCLDGKDIIDFDRKIVRNDEGKLVFNFGKHEGKTIVSQQHYVQWMLSNNFTHDTKKKLRKILEYSLK
jgi:DNA polymerase-3 subunit epsilon